MAGFYDDAPSRRLAYDVDGTVVFFRKQDGSGTTTEISSGDRGTMNSESESSFNMGFNAPTNYVILLFPELRDLDGIFYAYTDNGKPSTVDTSPDTTNGWDGVWTEQITDVVDEIVVNENFRDEITAMGVASQKGVRIRIASSGNKDQRIAALHYYGVISAGETPDRILFLDTENSDAVFVKPLDFGDVPRGQTQTRTFKIKNNSGSKTINTIFVTAKALYLNAAGWYTFGNDGISYVTNYSVGNLTNGAEETIYLQQIIPDGETLGLQTARIEVSHASVT